MMFRVLVRSNSTSVLLNPLTPRAPRRQVGENSKHAVPALAFETGGQCLGFSLHILGRDIRIEDQPKEGRFSDAAAHSILALPRVPVVVSQDLLQPLKPGVKGMLQFVPRIFAVDTENGS
ncbi:MAG: hypothetical protein V5B44_05270 [Candidatus Accumulibacter necessarius]|jgi:hypothetical protein|uniref:hypothetical protein n=1 Tax=Candidatus Accumulibacter necessarius TaxID=2954386 RepID=UPI002FC39D64